MTLRTLYVCNRCGEELDAGDADWTGRHAYCGGQLDPNGSYDDGEDGDETPEGLRALLEAPVGRADAR